MEVIGSRNIALHLICFRQNDVPGKPGHRASSSQGVFYLSEKISKIEYHPGFVSGMELFLWDYRDKLHFEEEHFLSREPIRMDLLIIKKEENIRIDNDICSIFRMHNVIEYKSPDDELSIDDYYKTIAYASLYKSEGQTVDAIPVSEITASIFRHARPRELFKSLEKYGASVEKQHEGIYRVSGLVSFPTQIVVTRELDPETYSVFRVLTDKALEEDVRTFIRQASANSDAGYRRNADAVFQVSVSANQKLYEEIRRDPSMCDALKSLMQDELTTERINGAIETMREYGESDSGIISKIMSKYNLSEDEAKEYVLAPQLV